MGNAGPFGHRLCCPGPLPSTWWFLRASQTKLPFPFLPCTRRSVSPGTELEAIEAELKALEAQKAAERKAAATGEAGLGVGDAPGTPDELEFEDDDGTIYVWDHKWVGKGRSSWRKNGWLGD